MNKKPTCPLPKRVNFYHPEDLQETGKRVQVSSWEKASEGQLQKEEIMNIIFKSDHFIKQLKFKAGENVLAQN